MKRKRHSLLILSVCVTCLLAACVHRFRKPSTVLAESFETCPDGHAQLIDVPLRYGYVSLTDEERRDIDSLKYLLGGCVVSSASPTSLVVCTECRFRYESQDELWLFSSAWSKRSRATGPIVTQLNDILKPTDSVMLWQELRNGRKIRETISCDTRLTIAQFTDSLQAFVADQGGSLTKNAPGLFHVQFPSQPEASHLLAHITTNGVFLDHVLTAKRYSEMKSQWQERQWMLTPIGMEPGENISNKAIDVTGE